MLYVADDDYWVLKSTDGGDSWTVVGPPYYVHESLSGNLLAIDPNVPSHIYLGSWGYIGETPDGGQTWSGGGGPLNQGTPNRDPRALAVDHGTETQTLYAGFGGVWACSNIGPRGNGIHSTQTIASHRKCLLHW